MILQDVQHEGVAADEDVARHFIGVRFAQRRGQRRVALQLGDEAVAAI